MNQSPALKTEWSDEWKCFVAYTGDKGAYDSRWVGEGTTPENARSDYWSQANGDTPTAMLCKEDDGSYVLYDGRTTVHFDDKESAIAYADKRNWII